jgi:hypothetical protein
VIWLAALPAEKGPLEQLSVQAIGLCRHPRLQAILRSAPQLLETLCTSEGTALPPNTLAAPRREMARLRFVKQQIKEIETARLERLQRAPNEPGNAMVHLLTG